jgi:outer membrane protein OmpA-like peptidoglycan-associated protein
LVALLLALALSARIEAFGGDVRPSESQILDALKAKGPTRCPHASTPPGCGGARLDRPSAERPDIDVEITFDYASARLDPRAVLALRKLDRALNRLGLGGGAILVAGHTDAKGSESYNQRLSERRAETVKRFLIKEFGVAAKNLLVVGYGKDRPKNEADPFADANRRVHLTSM